MSATPSRFYALFLRAQYAHVVRSALPRRLYCVITPLSPERRPSVLVLCMHKVIVEVWRSKVVPGSSWRFSLVLDSSHCVTNSFLDTLLRFASRFHIFQVAVGAQRDRSVIAAWSQRDRSVIAAWSQRDHSVIATRCDRGIRLIMGSCWENFNSLLHGYLLDFLEAWHEYSRSQGL